jgi:glucosamine--fructose-6-phosphate aminotransferase (isomerizing)
VALNRLCFVACGTSWHAGLVGRYLIEAFARLPVEVDIASEFRCRRPVVDSRVLTVPISQSGATADTLEALREARVHGSRTIAVCNVLGSPVARESEGVIYTRAGAEIGVVSTKAFTAQLVAITLLAVKLGLARGFLDRERARLILAELATVPTLMNALLRRNDQIHSVAARFADRTHFVCMGRGIHYPLALEGALKLKEIAGVQAEGHAAGEMKHGPIARIERGTPVLAIAPSGPTYEAMVADIAEVNARDGAVIALVTAGDDGRGVQADVTIPIPPASPWVQPLLAALPLQLLAYHLAVVRGRDVDEPRNRPKTVAVE